MATGILETCQEGDRWNPCGGSREVFVYEGLRLAACDLCGLVTEVAGEDFDDSDDIFNAAPTILPREEVRSEPRDRRYYCDDNSDINPWSRTTHY